MYNIPVTPIRNTTLLTGVADPWSQLTPSTVNSITFLNDTSFDATGASNNYYKVDILN